MPKQIKNRKRYDAQKWEKERKEQEISLSLPSYRFRKLQQLNCPISSMPPPQYKPPPPPPPHHRPHHNHNHSDSHAMHNCHRDEGAASQPQDNYCLCVTNTSTAVLFQSAAHCQNCYIQVFNIVRFLDWICVGNVLSWLMSRNFLQMSTAILIWTTGYWELVILFNLIFTMTLFGSIWLRLKRRKVVSI